MCSLARNIKQQFRFLYGIVVKTNRDLMLQTDTTLATLPSHFISQINLSKTSSFLYLISISTHTNHTMKGYHLSHNCSDAIQCQSTPKGQVAQLTCVSVCLCLCTCIKETHIHRQVPACLSCRCFLCLISGLSFF